MGRATAATPATRLAALHELELIDHVLTMFRIDDDPRGRPLFAGGQSHVFNAGSWVTTTLDVG